MYGRWGTKREEKQTRGEMKNIKEKGGGGGGGGIRVAGVAWKKSGVVQSRRANPLSLLGSE